MGSPGKRRRKKDENIAPEVVEDVEVTTPSPPEPEPKKKKPTVDK